MRNITKKFIAIFTASILMASSSSIAASAATKTYSGYTKRGAVITWVKSNATWTAKNSSTITSYDYWQTHGGIGAKNGGMKKLSKSSSMMHYANCTTVFSAGVTIGGVPLKYERKYIDQIRYDCVGNKWITLNV